MKLYSSTKVKMPKPEIYVVYTGEIGDKPDTISLSKEFFNGEKIGVEIVAKVIYESDNNSIINQYIKFSKVYDEQRKIYNRSREAIIRTIQICKDRNILREYLESRESEVITIMMSLFDEEEIMKSFIKCERYDAEQKALQKKANETAIYLLKNTELPLQEIANASGLKIKDIEDLENDIKNGTEKDITQLA